MRKLYSFFLCFTFIIPATFIAQQPDAVRTIQEMLLKQKPHRYSANDPNVISGGMIVNAAQAGKPTGTPVTQFSDAELFARTAVFSADTLAGFDFTSAKAKALNDGFKMFEEFRVIMAREQYQYVKKKYNLPDAPVTASQNAGVSASKLGSATTFASACSNIDFEDGNLVGWTGVSGYNTNSNAALTIPNSALTVAITSTDQDIYSCSDINLITTAYGNDPVGGFNGKDPNGGSYSIRVGGFNINTSNGYGFGCSSNHWWGGPLNYYANGEYIEKSITVTAANSLLSFDYAVILNDGGHTNGNQPYFHVFVTNSAGAVLSTCTQYYVQAVAGGPPAGFTNSGYVNSYDNSVLYYKNWTSNSINLTPYIGSTVKIRFVAAGCTAGAHMAWAYVDAICGSANILASNSSPCVGQTVVLTAPPVAGGSYSWSGPGIVGATNTQNVTVNATGTYSVVVTPSQGASCAYTLTSPITFNPNPSLTASVTNSLNCTSTTAQINISTNASSPGYSTTGPGVAGGGTSANVTVNAGGTYNILVTNGVTGCSTSSAVTITQNTTPPSASASASGSLNCTNTSVTLNGGPGSGVTYAWTGPGGFTSSSQNPNVSTGGTYNLVVTSTFNGCSSAPASTTIPQNTTPPVASAAASGSLNCATTSINLIGGPASGVTYAWTGPGGFTSSLQNPTGITTGGTYNLIVTSTSNGCTSAVSSTTIPQNTTPPVASAAASGSLNCTNISATLFGGPASGVTYAWTGPGGYTSNLQNPTINQGGTYNLVVTSTTNGCSSSIASTTIPQSTTAVSASALPSGSLNCTVNSVNVAISTTASPVTYTTTGPGVTAGANSANVTVNAGGIYSYTVTNTSTLCKTVGTFSVTQNTTPPTAVAAASGSLNCANASATLNASPSSGVTYTWTGPGGFTSSSANPTINVGGTYNLAVTSTTNGCTSATSSTTVPQNTTAVVVSATPSGSLNCTVTSVNVALTTTASPASYTLTGPGVTAGANSSNPTVNLGGIYNYTVINSSSQCKTTGTVSVTQNTTSPSASINPPAQINCTASAVTLSGNPTTGVSYSWSGPGGFTSTSGNPSVSNAGTYSLTVTSTSNNCTGSATTSVSQNFSVSATATVNNVITCDPNSLSINLFASPSGMNYTWTATNGGMVTSGQNAVNATGYGPGTYSLFLYNPTNGCTASATVSPVSNTVQPAPAVSSSGTVSCSSATVNLSTSNVGLTYTWSPPAGSSVSSPNSSVTAASGPGTYTLYVTNPNTSCTNSNVVSVTTQTTKPTPSITTNPTPTITCSNGTVTLNGSTSGSATYSWSGPGIAGSATNAAVSVASPGVYSLAVTSTSNGCTSAISATVNVPANMVTPTLSAASQTAAQGCGSSSVVTLSGNANPAPAGNTYTWTSGGTFASGVNSSTVLANSATTYTLSAAHPTTGCISSLVYTVFPSSGSPTVTATGATTGTVTCNTPIVSTTVTSNPSNNVTYSWSGPGIVGASNTSAVTASLAGNYNLVVTNTVNNCSSSNFSFVVTANNSPINPNAVASNTVNCINTTADITTNPSPVGTFTYNWSNGATTPSITVAPTTNTNYVVTVTNTNNGCSGSQTINVTANTNPPTAVSVSPSAYTITCADNTSTLTGSATGAATYTWLAPAGGTITAGANTPTINTAGAGVYTLIATGVNGCSAAAATATITPDINQPQVSFSNNTPSITCNGNTSINGTTLTVTSGTVTSYSWSPSFGVSSSTSSAVTFNQAGTYTVDILNSNNGCSNSYTVQVTDATATPTTVAGTATAQPLNCTNTLVTIAPTFTDNNLSYSWSGSGIVGSSNSSSVQVNQSGTYTLTVTNTLTGCSNSVSPLTVTVTGSSVPPTVTVTSSSTIGIGCQPNTSTITLSSQASSAVSYTWSNGANTSSISTSVPGVYTLSVTDVNNGCTASTTFTVDNNSTAPTLTSSAVASLPCGGGTTSLSAVSSNTNVSFSWTGNGIVSGSNTASPVINQPGVYTVTATDAITGCTSSSTVGIVQTTVSALAAADVTVGPAPLTVNFSNQSLGATSYSWSLGDGSSSVTNAPSNTYANAGSYTVVLIATNGACSDSDTLIIKVQSALGVIPEVFTPNSDGHNDVFVIQGIDSYPNNNFQVFNRWGNPVYSAKPYKNDWDGSPNAQGATGSGKLPTGTYYYMLELGDKEKTIYKGFVQIQY